MAQFYSDLTELAIGTGTPTGWTSEIGGGTASIATDSGAAADGLSRAWTVATASTDYSWDAVGSGIGDMEVLVIMLLPALTNNSFLMSFARQQAGAISGYSVRARDTAGTKDFILSSDSAGTGTNIGTISKTWAANDIWWAKVRCSGTTISGKAWKEGTLEPDNFDATASSSTWATGKAGHRSSTLGTKLYFISAGTLGDSAPRVGRCSTMPLMGV